jgi:hypothetical protein
MDYVTGIWLLSSVMGATVCLYSLNIAYQVYQEQNRRGIDHGRGVVSRGNIRRGIKRSLKFIAFAVAGILAMMHVSGFLIIGILVFGNIADTVESIWELVDERMLENYYIRQQQEEELHRKLRNRRWDDKK